MHTDSTTYDTDGSTRLTTLKRSAYLFALSAGIVAVLFSHLLGDTTRSPVERILLPVVGGWLTIALIITLFTQKAHARTLRFVEVFTHTGVALYFVIKFAYVLLWSHSGIDIGYEFLESSVWVICVYTVAFLIFDKPLGARWSLAYYGIFLGLGLFRFAITPASETRPGEVGAVIQYYIATGAFIGILFSFGRIKAAYIRADVEAAVSRRMANTDFLTRLPNRRRITQLLKQEIERSQRYDRALSIILFDLDRFKRVNDAYGHDVGDTVLKEVATLVTQNLRSIDQVGRWGGEEFLIIAPEVGHKEAAQQAERVRNLLAEHRHADVGPVTASFGVATREMGETANDLLKRADIALIHAKESGRDQVEVAS